MAQSVELVTYFRGFKDQINELLQGLYHQSKQLLLDIENKEEKAVELAQVQNKVDQQKPNIQQSKKDRETSERKNEKSSSSDSSSESEREVGKKATMIINGKEKSIPESAIVKPGQSDDSSSDSDSQDEKNDKMKTDDKSKKQLDSNQIAVKKRGRPRKLDQGNKDAPVVKRVKYDENGQVIKIRKPRKNRQTQPLDDDNSKVRKLDKHDQSQDKDLKLLPKKRGRKPKNAINDEDEDIEKMLEEEVNQRERKMQNYKGVEESSSQEEQIRKSKYSESSSSGSSQN
ncbi:UNKNOWN [Stylonychia lemnae]|uniref:Uncharacterized protein n=1 Tax=Stylonychia lemnae TaxID=5949 RepID=A0A077ZZI0_STYLE|nr:UNKNOWN [Stylonychia lemnae]|eukprot:CDW75007.1 UNKNOWN [Stylonychia lemnae]